MKERSGRQNIFNPISPPIEAITARLPQPAFLESEILRKHHESYNAFCKRKNNVSDYEKVAELNNLQRFLMKTNIPCFKYNSSFDSSMQIHTSF